MRACTWEEELLSGQKDGGTQGQPCSCEEPILAPDENEEPISLPVKLAV